jgi:hypothetical protein
VRKAIEAEERAERRRQQDAQWERERIEREAKRIAEHEAKKAAALAAGEPPPPRPRIYRTSTLLGLAAFAAIAASATQVPPRVPPPITYTPPHKARSKKFP